mmetsp:Transcript_18113/g.40162  ORF Transcript_18113/g.40162 Transcript_18113/m.40162 type:complete len:239 (-) Transcript_18113:280-996(-)
MRQVLAKRPECRWVSVTNADNAYGSRVVASVRRAGVAASTGEPPDILLAPLDSRNFAEQDYLMRKLLRRTTKSPQCVGLETALHLQGTAFTAQTLPVVGRVDLAAVFFDARRLRSENVNFGNFSDVDKFACTGCQDGYMTEYLVAARHWSHTQLPIDGLRSFVFHGPSPTLCVASGNVWFDYPMVNQVACLSHPTVAALLQERGPLYDGGRFTAPGSPRLCLRLSRAGQADLAAALVT